MLNLIVALTASVAGPAERPPIVTDRPDVAESSLTVPAGTVQVETGVEFGSSSTDTADGTSFGLPTKLRIGVIENAEIHLEGTVFDRFTVDPGDLSASGLADVEVGGKVHLLDPEGAVPSVGVLLALRVPIGADEVSGDIFVLRPTVTAEWDLMPALSFAANVGLTVPLDDRELFTDGLRFAGSFGIHPESFPEGLGVFVETFGEIPLGDGENVLAADSGATYLVNDDFQLDVYARVGLSDAAPDLAVGGGGSFRF
ncbi:MAG: transporter [Myxococcota bacterium]